MGYEIRTPKDLAATPPKLRELLIALLPPDHPILAAVEAKGRSKGEVADVPRSVYDPKMEALMHMRLTDAQKALDEGNVKRARELVVEAMEGVRDPGPVDALRPILEFLERVRKAAKAAFFSWGGNNGE